MSTIEVMRKALEALEHAEKDAADFQRINTDQTGAAITALRAELELLEGVEPVAWGMVNAETGLILDVICPEEHTREPGSYTVPLYTAPTAPAIPALTEEECEIRNRDPHTEWDADMRWAYALAAERAGVQIKEEGK